MTSFGEIIQELNKVISECNDTSKKFLEAMVELNDTQRTIDVADTLVVNVISMLGTAMGDINPTEIDSARNLIHAGNVRAFTARNLIEQALKELTESVKGVVAGQEEIESYVRKIS